MKCLVVIILSTSILLALPVEVQMYRDDLFKNHPALKAIKEELDKNRSEQELATKLPDPVFGGTVAISPIETRVGPQRGALMLSQKLLFPSLIRAKRSTKTVMEPLLHTKIVVQKSALIAEMLTYLIELYEVDEKIQLLSEYQRLIKTRIDVVESRYITASANRRAVISAELELIRNENKIKELEKQKRDKQISFNTHLGYELENDISVSSELFDIVITSVDSFIDLNPMLQLYEDRIALAEQKTELEKEKLFPGLTVGGKYLFNGKSEMNPAPMDNGKDAFQLFVTAPIPFSRNKNNLRVIIEKQNVHTLRSEKESLLRQLLKMFETLQIAEQEEERKIGLSTEQVIPKLLELEENSLELYSTGKLRFDELILIERELMMEKLLLLSAKVKQLKVKIEINKLLGETYEASK